MDETIENEWHKDWLITEQISEALYGDEPCYDAAEYAMQLLEITEKYMQRFKISEALRLKGLEEVD